MFHLFPPLIVHIAQLWRQHSEKSTSTRSTKTSCYRWTCTTQIHEVLLAYSQTPRQGAVKFEVWSPSELNASVIGCTTDSHSRRGDIAGALSTILTDCPYGDGVDEAKVSSIAM